MTANGVASAALRYADRGWPVFPCNGKRPQVSNGLHDATTDAETIVGWWEQSPTANVAIRTGAIAGLVVLDVDGDEGADALTALEREHGALPRTASVKTPRGGQHLYFRHPGGAVRNSVGQLGPGLDVRGDGGYVIAPPSSGPSGRGYEPDEQAPVADLPEWLLERLRPGNGRRGAGQVGDAIPEGQRNATLTSLAGSMCRRGMDEPAILAALTETNRLRCQPPLDAREVEGIAASIARYDPATNGRPSATPQSAGPEAHPVTWTESTPPKLVLPDVPAHDDLAALCAWLTSVFQLDRDHPVTGAVHQGLRGAEGHVEIRRAGAPPLRFEPAGAISSARRLLPILGWQLQPTDDEPYGFRDDHCRRIAHVVRLLCGAAREAEEQQETAAIVGTFMGGAALIEGRTTHGSGAQRYEAAAALQRELDPVTGRPLGAPRYLIDESTGELVIRVSELQEAARRHVGSSLARGWLDARIEGLGWERVRLDGHSLSGRAGRGGPHLRTDVYRGHLPSAEVTT